MRPTKPSPDRISNTKLRVDVDFRVERSEPVAEDMGAPSHSYGGDVEFES